MPVIPPYIELMDTLNDTLGATGFEEILADFELLDDWEDRYRYVIELGRKLDPLPEAERRARYQRHQKRNNKPPQGRTCIDP